MILNLDILYTFHKVYSTYTIKALRTSVYKISLNSVKTNCLYKVAYAHINTYMLRFVHYFM